MRKLDAQRCQTLTLQPNCVENMSHYSMGFGYSVLCFSFIYNNSDDNRN